MSRQGFSVQLGGEDFTLPVDFAALRACAKAGACPITLVAMASSVPPNVDAAITALETGLRLAGVRAPGKTYQAMTPVAVYNAGLGYIQALVSGMKEDSPGPKDQAEAAPSP